MTARRLVASLVVMTSLVLPGGVFAQTAQSALTGVVKDATGGVLPGVTVEAASPALIEKVRAVTTDSAGLYRIVDLRPGTYTITFSLPGFNAVRVEGFDLRADFTASVNADLKVGELNETITVSGEAPLVDVTSTNKSAVYNKEAIENLPNNRQIQSLAMTVPAWSAARTSTAPRRAASRCTAAASRKPTAPSTACRIAAARRAVRRSPST